MRSSLTEVLNLRGCHVYRLHLGFKTSVLKYIEDADNYDEFEDLKDKFDDLEDDYNELDCISF